MQQQVFPAAPHTARTPSVDIAALASRQAELSTSLARLRLDQRRLVGEIQAAGGKPSAAAQQQLVQLDLAIANAQVELSSARAEMATSISTSVPSIGFPVQLSAVGGNVSPLPFVFIIGVIVAVLGAFVLKGWRRARGVPAPADATDFLSARLDRVDQSLDAIAIEVERIAESQRFVAKTLAEFARGK